MASQRRTKNFATDPQTPLFLYAILKQLDLRSIDWNEVADGLGISNGHAARMRYSRMRSQFTGLSSQPKPPKPKKEDGGESKSSKSKAKHNKRLLLEEENERMANHQPAVPHRMQQESDPKRIKMEPQSFVNPWNHGGMYTGYAPYSSASAYWTQPTIETEPSTMPMQSLASQSPSNPAALQEDDFAMAGIDHATEPTVTVKQEPASLRDASHMPTADIVKIEREAELGTPVTSREPSLATNGYSSFPLAQTVNTYFERRQTPFLTAESCASYGGMPGYATSAAFMHDASSVANTFTPAQHAFTWTAPGSIPTMTATFPDDYNELMLNPRARTYQETLTMPLYRRNASASQVVAPSSLQQEAPPTSTGAQCPGERQPDVRIITSAITALSPNEVKLTSAIDMPSPVPSGDRGLQSVDTPVENTNDLSLRPDTSIEVLSQSDDELEEGAVSESNEATVQEVKIKKEIG
jgi:hypothetical protein